MGLKLGGRLLECRDVAPAGAILVVAVNEEGNDYSHKQDRDEESQVVEDELAKVARLVLALVAEAAGEVVVGQAGQAQGTLRS